MVILSCLSRCMSVVRSSTSKVTTSVGGASFSLWYALVAFLGLIGGKLSEPSFCVLVGIHPLLVVGV